MADAIISIVVDQLSIIIKDQIQDVRSALGVEKEIKNLSSKLNKIRAVLNDAERRSFKEEIVKLWVDEIKDLCYDVEDVLDEWITRSGRQQMERSPEVEAAPGAGSCSSFLPSCFHFKKIVMHRDIANKIKELDSRLDRITKEKDQFNFVARTHISGQESKRVTTTSFVDASEIQGRDIDASALISKLVEDNNNGPPVVISIVGAGGIGKTTLAQLVYGDEQIKAHFDERVWVCVSQPFDQIKIAKDIVDSITKSFENLSERSLQVLLEKIQSTLSQKRFLLVLDDVWTEDYAKWEPFNNCLKHLGKNCPGSRILVTSRKNNVARMMGSVYEHPVELISDTDAWSLLSRIAFSGRSSSNSREDEEAYSVKFKDIGQKIAQKCKGLPLAVKVIGGLLRSKDTEEEWKTVLSQLDTKFSNVEEVETYLFPHLYLSYDDLTSQMKRCFSYCAVFPKDYEINVEELIRIWMSQGYLTTTKNGRSDHNQMEQKGQDVFQNLAMRSLFQDFKNDYIDSNIIESCKMHDIVHDFAEFLTKNECYSVVWQEDKVKIENLRHLSWQKTRRPMDLASNYGVLGKLRTFFAKDLSPEQLTANMFNGLKSVRVLGLHNCMLSKLPKEIGNLFHLRYIDLCWSKVEELPDSICTLDNLQTLNLQGCDLSKLPERIGNLRNLSKIDLSWSKVEELPDSICSLDNLQTLNLRRCKCLSKLPEGIGNLRHLSMIYLSRSGVKELPDSICSLDNLEILDLEVCECLPRLPKGIGSLRQLSKIDLSRSGVKELPDSICSLDNFQTLNLRGCECLSKLPEGIGNLCQLSMIDLSESGVKELPDSICSLDNLQTLNLRRCDLSKLPEGIGNLRNLSEIDLSRSKVEELPDSICSLANLEILDLEGCECLSKLPEGIGNLRQLSKIDLSQSGVKELPDSICSLDNLQILILAYCKSLSRLPQQIGNLRHLSEIDLYQSKIEELPDSICSLSNLESLNLARCQCLSRFPEGIENLNKLRSIDLSGCKVEELPDSICSLDNLETLYLKGCECLSKLPEEIGNLHKLRWIDLSECKVEKLPDSIWSLDNLESLNLAGCQCLSRLPEGIGNLRHLSEIDLSRSKIEELPDSIWSLDNLKVLSLAGCQCLSRLSEEIGNLRHLSWINLSMSKIEELPDSICSLNKLEILNLKGCECLSRLPDGIENLHRLGLIDLRGCKVELPDSIYSLDHLKIRVGELNNAADDQNVEEAVKAMHFLFLRRHS